MTQTRTAIGIDFGGTTIKSATVRDGAIVERGEVIDTLKHDTRSLEDALVNTIKALKAAHPDVASVGVGLPGFVDSVNGIVHHLTNVPGWHEVPLRRLLGERTALPVTIENDANAMAYGEWRYGAAKDGQNVVCITLGTGVGGALILDGRLYRGAQLGAGEIGHMSIDYRGIAGPYGNFGGLEEYVGNQQIAERAVERYRATGRIKSIVECTPAELAKAAEGGDPVAAELWEEVGTEIGAALASVIWILNPDTIVIGGGVARAGELLFAPIQRAVHQRTIPVFHEHLRIVPATLGNDAGIIGCATLAMNLVAR
ncbi:ROK family protein [Verrucomicrobiota bacterium sgz303538]